MLEAIRCGKCEKLLARTDAIGRIEIKCPRCKTLIDLRTQSSPSERRRASGMEKHHERNISTP
ncbi:MAG: Com family DNA-binding transcriptional regulator [Magnetococcales bacterium]|nr:Com family DNA-binding transcriptional regulator [Magnetococcales bacterium]